jgi:hypothetical protein
MRTEVRHGFHELARIFLKRRISRKGRHGRGGAGQRKPGPAVILQLWQASRALILPTTPVAGYRPCQRSAAAKTMADRPIAREGEVGIKPEPRVSVAYYDTPGN